MKPSRKISVMTKRTFLAAGASTALAACGSANDLLPASVAAGTDPESKLPAVLTESTAREKSFVGDFYNFINTAVQELRNCKGDILRWNQIAIDATGRDHKPPAAGETRVFGEQLGPCRSSRAMAIVHIALYDAVGSITGAYKTYSPVPRQLIYADIGAAIAKAGYDSLSAMFPSQRSIFAAELAKDLARVNPLEARAQAIGLRLSSRTLGLAAGTAAAAAIIRNRSVDGSQHEEPTFGVDFIPKAGKGIWSPDPITNGKKAIGAKWPGVRPFAMNSGDQFRLVPPPQPGTSTYAAAYDEVQRLGGDGTITPTSRTPDQTFAGIFWAYDGTPSLCAPPRLYNQIATQIANQQASGTLAMARLLMLLNVGMADSAIAAWDSKFHYQVWRPVTGLRANINGDAGGSVTPNFTPLGAPASNLAGPNFTPPFPAYPSGHATFGGTLFQTLRAFYKTDNIAFTFVSDEYNGTTKDNQGNPRVYHPRSFANLTQAEEENGRSRIYLGIHWDSDKTEGIKQGRNVADFVMAKL
jgi:PAP2 superfamily